MLKKFLISCFLFIFILVSYTSMCYATSDTKVQENFSRESGEFIIYDDLTKENADYVIVLKVGQKCKIESNFDIKGYVMDGEFESIDISLLLNEITAIKVGNAGVYIDVGDEVKTIYITVEENIENKETDLVVLKIDEEGNIQEDYDYKVTLKVGQKCIIKTIREYMGRSSFGDDCIEYDGAYEIIATKPGTTVETLNYSGETITIHITVVENIGNKTLEPIRLKIDKEGYSDIIANIGKLPETGEQNSNALNSLYVIIGVCTLCVVIILCVSRKKK